MNETEKLFDEILQIRSQYKAEVDGTHKQWPKAIRERAMRLQGLGVSRKALSQRTGISYHTLAYWSMARKQSAGFHQLAVGPSLLPTADAATATVTKHQNADRRKVFATVTVTTPDGSHFRFASARDALLVLKGLKRGI
ncbi:MAG: hypothetical protein IPJ84_08355 [Bdellovibrionales bacterium]|jgi:hypothetical protein|nr:hypothetical protein [Bdellovibrionales bacterium]MBK7890843.1 hypothetical protein [Bdellovibrionales bacterium]